ncbi:YlzJ-like family protein [Falsibacillus albus]|uniref:Ribonuclease n=1 Tax=Falsibacillus albus TaxID=2478915 RepID=A0A3L7JY14_9BACI|nr:YlzJ-like family protein [Falsibacillus albus]RLQ95687.1 ribonuclease [Falsibacillus albus]
MILYTTVPQELIFPADASSYSNQKMVTFNGVPLMVEQNERGYRVLRVLSSDPSHFLDRSYEPGQYIQM